MAQDRSILPVLDKCERKEIRKILTGIKVWQFNLILKPACFLLAYFGSQPVVNVYLITLNVDVKYAQV